jgi:topoisomerase-4 subunit A
VFEIEFAKPRGKDSKPPQRLVFEDFISVKGIKALGNQVTTDKVKQFNVLEALPYEKPVEETPADIEVEDPETVDQDEEGNSQISLEL